METEFPTNLYQSEFTENPYYLWQLGFNLKNCQIISIKLVVLSTLISAFTLNSGGYIKPVCFWFVFCKKFFCLYFGFVFLLSYWSYLHIEVTLLQSTYSASPACTEKNKVYFMIMHYRVEVLMCFCRKKSRRSKNRKKYL